MTLIAKCNLPSDNITPQMNNRIKIIDFPFNSGATIAMAYFQQMVALRTMSLSSTAQKVLLDVGLRACDMDLYFQHYLLCRLVLNGIISWAKSRSTKMVKQPKIVLI